jgi:hypothetical protein
MRADTKRNLRGANGKPRGARVALECRADHETTVLVPLEAVGQVVELDVWSPPPQASPWIGGFALHECSLLVTVVAGRRDGRAGAVAGSRRARGIWLVTPGQGLGWILEVDEIGSLIEAEVVETAPAGMLAWFRGAVTRDARRLPWLDVRTMVAELGG